MLTYTKRADRRAMLEPTAEYRLRLAQWLADELADAPSYVLSISERQALTREVTLHRGRLIVQDGWGTQLGWWWPSRQDRRKLAERHIDPDGAVYNGFGTLLAWAAAAAA